MAAVGDGDELSKIRDKVLVLEERRVLSEVMIRVLPQGLDDSISGQGHGGESLQVLAQNKGSGGHRRQDGEQADRRVSLQDMASRRRRILLPSSFHAINIPTLRVLRDLLSLLPDQSPTPSPHVLGPRSLPLACFPSHAPPSFFPASSTLLCPSPALCLHAQ
eukprot:764346-Hanusia_phi.AAC.1